MKLAYTIKRFLRFCPTQITTVKPLNSGHLRVLKSLPAIERSPLLEVISKRLSHLGLNVLSAIWDVRYWEVSL